jgi:hypothetical protein
VAALCFTRIRSRFFEIAFVSVYFDQFASRIVNTNHSIMCAAVKLCVADCITHFQIPQATEGQRVRDQIKAALIFARADFVNVQQIYLSERPVCFQSRASAYRIHRNTVTGILQNGSGG